jgi:CMP-N-acetylneuraminic acid synthetase
VDVVGLIPAREGSKGIPRKNLAPLLDKPLLQWTMEAAVASRCLATAVVSTDSDEIADLATGFGLQVLRRPPELAADDTPMLDVVHHALGELDPCEVLVLLQPTSPLRSATHIDDAVGILLETGADSVVSVVRVPHRYHPGSLLELVDERLVPLSQANATRRQDKPALYARNGPAVLAFRPAAVHRSQSLFGRDCRPYLMRPEDSIDIDDPLDLELAAFLLARR